LADRIRLKIVGKGPQLKELKDLTQEYRMDSITDFVGSVPNEEVPSYLNQIDIFTAFSRSESFGVAVLEASACELPVIVSDVGGLPEDVQQGDTGYSIQLEHMDEIVEKLSRQIFHHKQKLQMEKKGRL